MARIFDITADVSRQRSGDKKIIKLFDSGLDVEYPVVAWVVGGNIPMSFTRDGQECGVPCEIDLHTLPEPLPLIVSYQRLFEDGLCQGYQKLFAARADLQNVAAVVETTYDPNTGESSAKTVWRKGELA